MLLPEITLDPEAAVDFHWAMPQSHGAGASPPSAIETYRQRYRREHVSGRYSGSLHLGFTVSVCAVTIVWCLSGLQNVTAPEWLTVPVTFLYANLVEYLGHRGPMHHPVRGLRLIFDRHTRQHHRFFDEDAMAFDSPRDYKAVLFPPVLILFYLAGFAAPAGFLIAWLFSFNAALLFVATAVGYFLNYEVLHFAYHAPRDSRLARLRLIKRLRTLHTLHHRTGLMQRYNFNITYPICDRLFGTYYRD